MRLCQERDGVKRREGMGIIQLILSDAFVIIRVASWPVIRVFVNAVGIWVPNALERSYLRVWLCVELCSALHKGTAKAICIP